MNGLVFHTEHKASNKIQPPQKCRQVLSPDLTVLPMLDAIIIDHDLDLLLDKHHAEVDLWDDEYGVWADELDAILNSSRNHVFEGLGMQDFTKSGQADVALEDIPVSCALYILFFGSHNCSGEYHRCFI